METLKFILSLLLLVCLINCRSEPEELLTYEEAMKRCIPRDVTQHHDDSGGTMTIYGIVDGDCILGAQLPAFSATTMKGNKIDTGYYNNKITVLNFWFINCKPCVAEMPGFNEIVKKYEGKPVNFLSISSNSPDDITEFLMEHPFDFEHVAYGEQIYRTRFQAKWGYPMTLMIDENMKIVQVFDRGMVGEEVEIMNAIDETLHRLMSEKLHSR